MQGGARGKGRPRGKARGRDDGLREAALTAILQGVAGGRDIGLGPFHALSKLLYSKRHDPSDAVRALAALAVTGRGFHSSPHGQVVPSTWGSEEHMCKGMSSWMR